MGTNYYYYYVNFLSISLKKKGPQFLRPSDHCTKILVPRHHWPFKRLLEYECTYYIKVISSDYIHAVVCRLLVENSEMI